MVRLSDRHCPILARSKRVNDVLSGKRKIETQNPLISRLSDLIFHFARYFVRKDKCIDAKIALFICYLFSSNFYGLRSGTKGCMNKHSEKGSAIINIFYTCIAFPTFILYPYLQYII